MKYLEQVSPLIAHRPHPTGEAAGLQYLHSQVLASGPLHQHPKAVYMVTCEFPISAKASGGGCEHWSWETRSPWSNAHCCPVGAWEGWGPPELPLPPGMVRWRVWMFSRAAVTTAICPDHLREMDRPLPILRRIWRTMVNPRTWQQVCHSHESASLGAGRMLI